MVFYETDWKKIVFNLKLLSVVFLKDDTWIILK